jgi:hypothetical protein
MRKVKIKIQIINYVFVVKLGAGSFFTIFVDIHSTDFKGHMFFFIE